MCLCVCTCACVCGSGGGVFPGEAELLDGCLNQFYSGTTDEILMH